jgi:hypothetical protein
VICKSGRSKRVANLRSLVTDLRKCSSALAALALLSLPVDGNPVGLTVGTQGDRCGALPATLGQENLSSIRETMRRSGKSIVLVSVSAASAHFNCRPWRLLFPRGSATAWRQFARAMRARGLPLAYAIESLQREQETSLDDLDQGKTGDAWDDGAGANREDLATMSGKCRPRSGDKSRYGL